MEEKQIPHEEHPYGIYIPQKVKSIIIGTFPIGKFTNPQRSHEIKPTEIDFYYGGETNQFWKLLGECFQLSLSTKDEITNFLEAQGFAMGDVIKSCRRINGGGSDEDLEDIKYNAPLLEAINKHQIKKLYFTSQKALKWFQEKIGSTEGREVIVLISPSGQGLRKFSTENEDDFKKWEAENPEIDDPRSAYRLYFYKKIFCP